MDKDYWTSYYKSLNNELKPSLFAKYVMSEVIKGHKTLIELGCGNGRDATYFANENMQVVAVDQCEEEIKFLNNRYKQLQYLDFKSGDFSELDDSKSFDIVYSRFTLHSVSKEQEIRTINWAYRNLHAGGYLCIEARGQRNEIYQVGEKVAEEENAFILDGHYRRFLNFEAFCDSLKQVGFVIEFAAEEKGFSPFKGKDETYIRVIARKNNL
jgi:ubiquinone/menaquinone biosynthesis C-methylase UbiE